MPDYSQEFKALVSSPLGKELLRELEQARQSQLESAENAETSEQAFSFTKQAAGVKLAIGHLHSLATILPTDEGDKSNR